MAAWSRATAGGNMKSAEEVSSRVYDPGGENGRSLAASLDGEDRIKN